MVRAEAEAVRAEAASTDAKPKKKSKSVGANGLALITPSTLEGGWIPKRGHSIVVASQSSKGFKSKLEINHLSRSQSIQFLLASGDQHIRPPLATAGSGSGDDGSAVVSANPTEAAISELCGDQITCLQYVRSLRALKQPYPVILTELKSKMKVCGLNRCCRSRVLLVRT